MVRHKKRIPTYGIKFKLICGTVSGKPETIVYENGSYKAVFEVVGTDSKTYLCVNWNSFLPNYGERVTVKGYEKNGVFIVENMLRNYTLYDL